MTELESDSPEETERLAARLAANLAAGDVVLVQGELRSGTPAGVRAAARALGVEGPVTSPTYTIGHRYRGRVDVSHLDLYRFEGMSHAEWGDLEEYFEDAVVFVEWPQAGAGFLPAEKARVSLQHVGETRRLIMLESDEKSLETSVFTGADPRV